jgi:hypothetical protein
MEFNMESGKYLALTRHQMQDKITIYWLLINLLKIW